MRKYSDNMFLSCNNVSIKNLIMIGVILLCSFLYKTSNARILVGVSHDAYCILNVELAWNAKVDINTIRKVFIKTIEKISLFSLIGDVFDVDIINNKSFKLLYPNFCDKFNVNNEEIILRAFRFSGGMNENYESSSPILRNYHISKSEEKNNIIEISKIPGSTTSEIFKYISDYEISECYVGLEFEYSQDFNDLYDRIDEYHRGYIAYLIRVINAPFLQNGIDMSNSYKKQYIHFIMIDGCENRVKYMEEFLRMADILQMIQIQLPDSKIITDFSTGNVFGWIGQ